MRIGILGAGSIGETLARAVDEGKIQASLVAIADQDSARAQKLASSLKHAPPVVPIERLVELSDLVVEAASQAAVPHEDAPRNHDGRMAPKGASGASAFCA